MVKISRSEADTVKKFLIIRGTLWEKYIESIDPTGIDGSTKFDIITRELMRMSFITGIWYFIKEEYNLHGNIGDKEHE